MRGEMIELYRIASPHERMNTQYGIISGTDWLEKEKERIGSQPDRRAEIRGLSLWVDCNHD